jgi:fucose permease
VVRKEEEKAGTWVVTRSLFRKRLVGLYFLGIFAYVGLEQGTANWISQFLLTYHGYDPHTVGARTVSWFWGLMTIGCLLGFALLKVLDSRKILVGFSAAAAVFLALALFGPGTVALLAFPLVGFAASVMWSIIFSLALNSLDRHHGAFSGILCTGIVGGAVVPLAVGRLGDALGLRLGMLLLYPALGYVFSIGIWARPLVPNETIASRKRKAAS